MCQHHAFVPTYQLIRYKILLYWLEPFMILLNLKCLQLHEHASPMDCRSWTELCQLIHLHPYRWLHVFSLLPIYFGYFYNASLFPLRFIMSWGSCLYLFDTAANEELEWPGHTPGNKHIHFVNLTTVLENLIIMIFGWKRLTSTKHTSTELEQMLYGQVMKSCPKTRKVYHKLIAAYKFRNMSQWNWLSGK